MIVNNVVFVVFVVFPKNKPYTFNNDVFGCTTKLHSYFKNVVYVVFIQYNWNPLLQKTTHIFLLCSFFNLPNYLIINLLFLETTKTTKTTHFLKLLHETQISFRQLNKATK
ncbi:hypothetical protein SAMN04488029_0908 [Reichenbachiella faecimaris]|uniref:Uncharacterized protein n=1 Tax=Reichenbachiella faecimaris TaxID=692418 RepID=A0A1W2G7I1_REIFA|nr:hypothetical protein SAMN04488029_0908 [Reichenbachiella faecimaris]